MNRIPPTSRALFASGMIAVGIVGLHYGDFASIWQGTPAWIPATTHTPIAYAAAVLMLLAGIGLLLERTAAISARALFFYLLLWVLLLRVPSVLTTPQIEVNWQGLSEIVTILTGCWILFATLTTSRDGSWSSFATGKRGIRCAQFLFGLALIPFGLSHFAYLAHTAELVPAWLPYHTAWAYLTGTAQLAAGVAVLLSIVPRLAAMLQAALLTIFTFLVWVPMIVATPTVKDLWTEITVSWAISAAAWVVAASIRPSTRAHGVSTPTVP
jgi:uncharacterized membrane protein